MKIEIALPEVAAALGPRLRTATAPHRSQKTFGDCTPPSEDGGTFRRRRPDPVRPDSSGVRWACARVRSGREFAVADDLRALGFRVFCPHGVRVSMRARFRGSEQRRRSERDYPVFGSYVFVGESAGLVLGRHLHWHIFDVLENAGGSRHMPAAFIDAAATAWVEGRWDGRVSMSDRFKGKTVRIVSGPMEGWQAVVEKLPSELQALVTVQMFGAWRQVRVDVSVLEVV